MKSSRFERMTGFFNLFGVNFINTALKEWKFPFRRKREIFHSIGKSEICHSVVENKILHSADENESLVLNTLRSFRYNLNQYMKINNKKHQIR